MIIYPGRENMYRAYRARLYAYVHIPTDASDQEIRQMIELGISPEAVRSFCDTANLSSKDCDLVIPFETLETRVEQEQPLTPDEGDRLYQFSRITAMAGAIFESDDKASNWLTKPKKRFLGKSPFSMRATTLGARQVEEVLIQLAEGFAF